MDEQRGKTRTMRGTIECSSLNIHHAIFGKMVLGLIATKSGEQNNRGQFRDSPGCWENLGEPWASRSGVWGRDG